MFDLNVLKYNQNATGTYPLKGSRRFGQPLQRCPDVVFA